MPRLHHLSIRSRLAIGTVLLVGLGLAVSTIAGVVLLRSYLVDRVDQQVGSFAPGGDRGPGIQRPDDPGVPTPVCQNPRDPRGLRSDFLIVVLNDQGRTVCSLGPDLDDYGPVLAPGTLVTDGRIHTVDGRDDDARWRVRASDRGSLTVVQAVSLADVDATVDRLVQLSLVVNGVVLLLTAAGAWWIARLGLHPLTRIEETAERIADGDLSQRVPEQPLTTEVGRLGHALNGMLGQIEDAFHERTASEAKLRRFISDASHELRTPIAAVRGHAEMWRAGITDDLTTVMGRIESESKRMGDLVNDMLTLARVDQARPLRQDPVDLLTLVTDAVVDAHAVQPEREIDLSVDLSEASEDTAPIVTGDEARLRQILGNLLTNALVHTPRTARVDVRLRADATHLEVSVADNGPGIAADATPKVFDRFFRADAGRSRDQGGSGLGLAIVKSLVDAHGGEVTCSSTVGEGTTFTLRLPRATS